MHLTLLAALALLLALPGAARADAAFCEALRRLVAGAQTGFQHLPAAGHNVPGSLEERRGVLSEQGGPSRAVYHAILLREPARGGPHRAPQRFEALTQEVARCLPDARSLGLAQGQQAVVAGWETPYARIALRRLDGGADVQQTEIELSVASRW